MGWRADAVCKEGSPLPAPPDFATTDHRWGLSDLSSFFLFYLKGKSESWIFMLNLSLNASNESILFKNTIQVKQNTSGDHIWLWTTSVWPQISCNHLHLEGRLIQMRFPETGLHPSNRLLIAVVPSPWLFPIPLAKLFYRKSISSPPLDHFCFHWVILSERSGGCLIITPSPWK